MNSYSLPISKFIFNHDSFPYILFFTPYKFNIHISLLTNVEKTLKTSGKNFIFYTCIIRKNRYVETKINFPNLK